MRILAINDAAHVCVILERKVWKEGRKHHQTLSRKSAQQQQTDTQHTLSTADVHICYLCRSSVASSKNIRERSRKREFLHKQYFIPWKEQKTND